VSGKAGNLKGKIVPGGNPFEGPRSDEYPNKPIKTSAPSLMFADAAKGLGYHPFPAPVAIASAAYNNSEGLTLGACEYCGFCNRIACEANAKASANTTIMPLLRPDPKFELRTRAFATKLIYDKPSKKVTSVVYTDLRTGEEFEQPANIVVLSSYVFRIRRRYCSRASASLMSARLEKASSARTTATSSRQAPKHFSRTRNGTPS
jgi:gluconate 2-dehydrogenase alpha chain